MQESQKPTLGEYCKTSDKLFMGDYLYLDGESVSIYKDLGEEVEYITNDTVHMIGTEQKPTKYKRIAKTKLLSPTRKEVQDMHKMMVTL